jgi:hypothetical protein
VQVWAVDPCVCAGFLDSQNSDDRSALALTRPKSKYRFGPAASRTHQAIRRTLWLPFAISSKHIYALGSATPHHVSH